MKFFVIFAALSAMALSVCLVVEGVAGRVVVIYLAVNLFAYAMAYAVRLPQIFLKRGSGSIHPISYLVFGPLHLLSWLSLLVAIRFGKEEPHHEIRPNLLLGRRLLPDEAIALASRGDLAVLDLTCEFAENRQLRALSYLCLPVLDHSAPTKEQISKALTFVEQHILKKPVFVHCALGHGRSATIVAAWLLRNKLTPDVQTAIVQLQALRLGVGLEAGQENVLKEMFPNIIS